MVARIVIRLLVILILSRVWIQNHKIPRTAEYHDSTIKVSTSLMDLSQLENDVIYVPGSNNESIQAAIARVSDNGIIEISEGSYDTPLNGFSILDQAKSFTIRSSTGATVILNGRGINRLLNFQNSVLHSGNFVTFEGITFANGFSQSDGVAAITINRGNAIFVDCIFRDNRKNTSPGQTVGGAITIFGGSTVFFLNTTWQDNWSQNGGAAIGIRDATMYVHNSIFRNNHTEVLSQTAYPCGAAINLGDSIVRISNTTFDSNTSGSHGAAIWAIGTFGKTKTDVIISNSTFINNGISRSIPALAPVEGGAIAAENNLYMRIYNSRFFENNAYLGGALTIFRAQVEIYNSVFRGNRATDTLRSSGFGGAISFNYYDKPGFASLLIEDTLIQGRFGNTTSAAQYAGGLSVIGEIPTSHPEIILRRVVFYDTDSHGSSTKAAAGGAISLSGADFLMEDSFVLLSDARHNLNGGIGGGITIYPNTQVDIRRSVIAYNSADTWGGGLSAIGSQVDISDSIFYANDVSPGIQENENYSPGAAAYVSSDTTLQADGIFDDSLFLKNIGMAIYDNDRSSGPINATVYNRNQFYETSFSNRVYKNSLTSTMDPEGLNNLVVTRAAGVPSTDKSLINNNTLTESPTIAKLIAVPSRNLSIRAAGDSQPSTSWLVYLWDGLSASLNGLDLTNHSNLFEVYNGGNYTLSVDGKNTSVQIDKNDAPNLSTSFVPGSPGNLNWNLTEGTFLDVAITQGIPLTKGASGSVTLPAYDSIYYLYMVTAEGGVVKKVNTQNPLLVAPSHITILAGQNLLVNRGYISIHNEGGQTLVWTAATSTPDLIQILNSNGQTETNETIILTVNTLSPGQYVGHVTINAGSAGVATVTIDILVVHFVNQISLPIISR